MADSKHSLLFFLSDLASLSPFTSSSHLCELHWWISQYDWLSGLQSFLCSVNIVSWKPATPIPARPSIQSRKASQAPNRSSLKHSRQIFYFIYYNFLPATHSKCWKLARVSTAAMWPKLERGECSACLEEIEMKVCSSFLSEPRWF